MTAPANPRADAARALHRVVWKHQTLDQASGVRELSPLTQEILYGSLRHFYSLSNSVNRTLHHPLKSKDHIVWCLMLVGAYQLLYMRTPDHAAIHETVAACKPLGRPWAKGLVNAVLRRLEPAERSVEHPSWMIRALKEDYGEDAEALMLANNERAPMCLRINTRMVSTDAYRKILEDADIPFRERARFIVQPEASISTGPETLILTNAVSSKALPGYETGLVSIQDAGAQYAAYLLRPEPGDRLLDACAAPGGKLFHLAERFPDLQLTALESSSKRLQQLHNELRRLHNDVPADGTAVSRLELLEADARNLEWWDHALYGQILLDAPCSGSGTLRRHPDIKILRQASDLEDYAGLQLSLLANLWRVLRAGGTLLYCTCSLFAKENDDVIAAFMESHPDAELHSFALDSGRPTRFGWQLLPTDADTDGFYYARLRRAPV